MKKTDKEPANLSVDKNVKGTLAAHIATNKRKGFSNLSEVTERLWIAYLRRKGVRLPPGCKALLKNGA